MPSCWRTHGPRTRPQSLSWRFLRCEAIRWNPGITDESSTPCFSKYRRRASLPIRRVSEPAWQHDQLASDSWVFAASAASSLARAFSIAAASNSSVSIRFCSSVLFLYAVWNPFHNVDRPVSDRLTDVLCLNSFSFVLAYHVPTRSPPLRPQRRSPFTAWRMTARVQICVDVRCVLLDVAARPDMYFLASTDTRRKYCDTITRMASRFRPMAIFISLYIIPCKSSVPAETTWM